MIVARNMAYHVSCRRVHIRMSFATIKTDLQVVQLQKTGFTPTFELIQIELLLKVLESR